MPAEFLAISDEVRAAVADGRPVLALESTIFTHGLPRPRNVEVALEAEERVRAAGVVPATIGLVDGVPTVGLSTDEIERLSNDDAVVKVSLRDIPVASAKKLNGGTTVAATAYLATLAGVRVFSTGGLGGVHRGAETTFDESADLGTLATLPLVVVSAGVKSILDIPLTLERLETLNLAVVGYRTTDYPGFYISDSGYDIEYSVDSPEEIARVVAARDALRIASTLLVANPVAADKQLDPAVHDSVLAEALAAAEAAGISGNETTPFLLDFVQRTTGGASLDVNVEVYRGNVALGAQIAVALTA
ncbi:pseudouridine-5'-phosphate glycosidase [Herbiconiux sp. CPCC 203407]|uniref:Pseudouridine-5'-phosphate glycosidase n=1 Tax=Herbiconiux oxytropis TaxID=2970915 RepID=A0AA41XE16_9MICO|nr:pseudouridine-5'-phosphate glycosidase [Herbiconiux oxytropis]MCS5721101.1 pseudouridine-5'-phosphate glycosidase [Herbiconiux oxytropis]MCS5724753.1 pseudouridine-5'-phosphate glycosidase [Herbiconiux oxytropis]